MYEYFFEKGNSGMIKKKTVLQRILAAVMAGMIVLTAGACGSAPEGTSSGNTSSTSSEAADSSSSLSSASSEVSQTSETAEDASITLTDQTGRTITLEQPAESLVSCYYITTYATIALGVSDRVVGLEKKAETRQIYQLAAPELLEKPQLGTLKEFNVEAAAALEPDLVLMPVKLQDYAASLEELDIPVLLVNPETQEDMEEMLTLIAKACGVEENAEKLLSYYAEQLERMKTLTEGTESPSIYLTSNSSYLETATEGMYQADLIQNAGGVNAAASIEGDYWTEVSYESILSMNPDVIVIPSGASFTKEDLMNDAQLAEVTAIKNQAVYQMPSLEEWDSPIPSGILGVMWTTSVLHPEEYPFDTFVSDAVSYYQQFYGFELDAALVTK